MIVAFLVCQLVNHVDAGLVHKASALAGLSLLAFVVVVNLTEVTLNIVRTSLLALVNFGSFMSQIRGFRLHYFSLLHYYLVLGHTVDLVWIPTILHHSGVIV